MALLKIWEGSRGIMRLLVIQFVCWLGCFSTFALAQFDISEGVTGSVTFPALGITCVSNLAVFVTSLIRGRLDLEMGARDVLDILLSPKLEEITGIKHGYGLTTCMQEDAVIGGGGDQGTASREESDVHAASTRSTETSTEDNVNTSVSTERGGLQIPPTAEIVIHIDSTKGQAGSEGGGGAAAVEALEEAKEAVKEARGGGEGAEVEALENAKEALKGGGGGGLKEVEKAKEALKEAKEALKEILKEAKEALKEVEEAKEALKEARKEAAEKAAAAAIPFARKQGLERAAVIMLSNDTANWSMKQFMKSNAYVVQSVVLPFLPLERALSDIKVSEELTSGVTIQELYESCDCKYRSSTCHCIVFWTMKEITKMLATRMPATLKLLSNSLCLLPCSTCLTNGCHECNRENLLRAESEPDEGQPMRQRVVSDILDNIRAGDIPAGEPIGICIPMNDARGDDWTKLLLKSLRSKDAEGRGVTNMAAEALEGYLGGGRGSEEGSVEYDIFSFVVPRLTEVLINLVLTFWFRVDAFSSALLARRTVREYLVDTKSSGFAANAFLTKVVVKSNGDNTQVCQVLTFRGRDWLCFITFISVGCVNVICALGWALLITFEGGPDTSQPPSLPRVAVIIAAIGSPWVVLAATMMVAEFSTSDDIDSFLSFPVEFFLEPFSYITVPRFVVRLLDFLVMTGRWFVRVSVRLFVLRFLETLHCMTVPRFVVRPLDFLLMTGRWFVRVFVFVWLILVFVVISPVLFPGGIIVDTLRDRQEHPYAFPLIATGTLLEMACFVSWSALAGALGIKGFGRWLYGALQILIWVKWATGSHLLNKENSSEFFGKIPDRALLIFYSSAFWLNAVLAGVRCKWEAWPWKHNHLF